jgi:hypothetical protein
MNCADFEKRLHAQFSPARLDETADLAEHARECPGCRATAERFHLLADALGVWRAQIPEVELSGAVVAAHRSHRASADPPGSPAATQMPLVGRSAPRKASPSTPAILARAPWSTGPFGAIVVRRLAAASVAALLLVAVWLSFTRRDAPPAGSGPQLARTSEDAPVQPSPGRSDVSPAPAAIGPPQRVPEPVQALYYDLAWKAAGALGEVTAFVVPGSSPPPMEPSDPRPGERAGWIDGLQHQLKPIGRSLDHAFDFLWEAGQSADGSKT